MGALHPQFPYITESEVEASPLPFLLWTGRARARLVACHSNPSGTATSRFLYISYGDVAIHIRCGYPLTRAPEEMSISSSFPDSLSGSTPPMPPSLQPPKNWPPTKDS